MIIMFADEFVCFGAVRQRMYVLCVVCVARWQLSPAHSLEYDVAGANVHDVGD